jgi:hypothetical protein
MKPQNMQEAGKISRYHFVVADKGAARNRIVAGELGKNSGSLQVPKLNPAILKANQSQPGIGAHGKTATPASLVEGAQLA